MRKKTGGAAKPISTHAPAGGATRAPWPTTARLQNFYSRPCGRGDAVRIRNNIGRAGFLLTPLREGRRISSENAGLECKFLLTPLREGRQCSFFARLPAQQFLLTPLREGRRGHFQPNIHDRHFYSRPCGRGDGSYEEMGAALPHFYSRPCGRGDNVVKAAWAIFGISTHAPAGGATAIFHKFVMRFCGKLPKDDTVLCLASFGFPRRDPKAVYLAWISCANLPQKCVRQGLALKDQGTSCFHEGLASHAFDPVLV